MIPGLADANIRVVIAFSLVLIAGLLTYIAFFKDDVSAKKTQTSRSKN